MALEYVQVGAVFKEEHALEGVGLLDVAGTQDAVPAPFLVDGALCGVEFVDGDELLVEESVLLEVDLVLFAVGVVEVFPNGLPLLDFVAVQLEFREKFRVVGGLFGRQPLGAFGRVFQAPRRHEVGVVVVVDVVLVFVGPRHAKDDKLFLGIAPVDALRPEAGNGHEHL